jgi:hypothetical protein
MIAWELPESLCVGGQEWKIRTDFRAILDIIRYFADPEYEADESWLICLTILYIDFDDMPPDMYQEACEKAIEFIDMGIKDDGKKKPHTMDWEQDAPIILPAVNRVLGECAVVMWHKRNHAVHYITVKLILCFLVLLLKSGQIEFYINVSIYD